MSNPQAHLSVRCSRVKQYGDKYYIQNGTEFEIELFNPTTSIVCAVISINGKTQDSGLVLKPGQRFFLDRYMDVNRKFKFETYTVEAGNKEVEAAIVQNGIVKIEFYRQNVEIPKFKTPKKFGGGLDYKDYLSNGILRSKSSLFDQEELGRRTFGGPNSIIGQNDTFFNGTLGDQFSTNSCTYSATTDWMEQGDISKPSLLHTSSLKKETGRIEQGGTSDQSFNTVNYKFETWPCNTVNFQILPLSQKPVEEGEVAMYCSNCGRRAKKGENFCPKCGNDLVAQRKALETE